MINFRPWTKQHTLGLIIGLFTLVVSIFIVIGIFSWLNGLSYTTMFKRFTFLPSFAAKVISLAAIGNLPWFHFVSLKNKQWGFGQGIIMATIVGLVVMLLVKFFL